MGTKSDFWRRHLTDWRTSGLSQAAYCRRHGLDVKRWTYWRRTLKPTLPSGAAVPAVVRIVMSAPPLDGRVEVRLPNGLQVRVSVGLDPRQLVAVVQGVTRLLCVYICVF